ncbi:amino acid adenylation domain-containing protein [Dactylosporangium sp. NBC_01737]|uniref:amino acid adenylation domain-containing protein n=1 Tax=Dactylosporangium sp. NBC_01737 TaxID=2975959 RepID=UPI002E15B4B2|nr:amino acid adenylation domain-containing protein [Dactylosporangium sp. NBC_01737]
MFVALDRLPATASGKVDRSALPAPDAARTTGQAPRTPLEVRLAAVFADVLGVAQVGVDDDFFDLGGQSLLAIRVATRVRAELGVDLPVRAVFEARTVAGLAGRASLAAPGAGPVIPRHDGPAPLSFAQQRLWFLDLLDGGRQYHVTTGLRLTGPLDVPALARALTALTERHAVLRTRYVPGPGDGIVQVVDPAAPVALPVQDVPPETLSTVVDALAGEPFDLAARAPLAVHLLRVRADEHVLLLVLHHIATDGRTDEILLRDLAAHYTGVATAAPPVRYTDYAAWQRAQLTDDVVAAELAHWRERLDGIGPLDLPADRPRPAVRDTGGAAVTVDLPDRVMRPLLQHGRRHGATAFMTMLSVFAALLRRWTGEDDLAIGMPVTGREHPGLDDVAGLFVNTVVVRVDASGDPTATELAGRVRDRALDAFGHAGLPFDRLVEEVAPHRDPGRLPLCDVMFDLRDTPAAVPAFAGLGVAPVHAERRTAKFDLTLTLTALPGAGGYRAELEYATALFDRATAERMAGHLATLAAAVAHDPDRPVSRLELLTDAERDLLLHGWNPSPDPEAGECLHEAFEAQAARDPDALAVEDHGERITYRELSRRSTELARRLVDAGVRAESPVAVHLERSSAAVVTLLAVAKAGGVYVPLGTGQPPERLAGMLADLEPALLVTHERLRGDLAGVAVPVLAVDDPAPPAARATDLPGSVPDQLAYMIYTSGSTGRPKAAMVTHRAYTHHCRVTAGMYGLGPHDRAVLLSSLTFDLAMEQLGVVLLAGGSLAISDARFWAPSEVPDRLAAAGVTHVLFTPAYYRQVMDGVRPGDPRLAGLRMLHVGADQVTHGDARRWYAADLPGSFTSAYGPTEATVVALTHPVDPADLGAADGAGLPIGRPVPGTRAYVLDEHLQPVPVGVAGELCLGGVRLARGYLRRARLTADRFVPDPFGGRPGDRLYRTGDQVRLRADGLFEFLGRLDTQVKVRGFRIELGEIEAAIGSHPAVAEAAVAVRDLTPGDPRLVGYVVPRPGGTIAFGDLREHVRARVPDYMVPTAWLALDGLPLTASKKVDRRALPTPGPGDVLRQREHTGPRDEVEAAIAAVWAEVLGVSTVDVTEDFFDLGGHSLLATRLLTRLDDLFGLRVPLRLLFEATTVATQATALARLAADEEEL